MAEEAGASGESEKKEEPYYKLTSKAPFIKISVDFSETFGIGSAEFGVACDFKGKVEGVGKSLEIASLVAIQLESTLPAVFTFKADGGEKVEMPLSKFRSEGLQAKVDDQDNEVSASDVSAKTTELRAVLKQLGSEINEMKAHAAELDQSSNCQNI